MKVLRVSCVLVGFLSLALLIAAQTSSGGAGSTQAPPPLIPFSSVATDDGGNTLSGVVSITFSFYTGQQGGEPLWTETQGNVPLDPTGHYSVQLGITRPGGVPTTLFTTGEARWLGVRIAEQGEQPRVLLLSVPYALKAADAETIGGLPPSAFVLAAPAAVSAAASSTTGLTASSPDAPPATNVTGSGTAGLVPLWTGTSTIGNSVLFQSAVSPFKIGINTTTPTTTLDVKGAGTIRGMLSLPALGVATATKGSNSQPLAQTASVFNSGTGTAVTQNFRWQAEPVGNDTSSASGSLNLLYGSGSNPPAETGLQISSKGLFTFAPGQTFPGSGSGTVTSVGSGAGLTGGPITSSGTLSVANAGVTNAMLQNPSLTVTASSPLTGGGSVALGGTTSLGLETCSNNQVLQFISGTWKCANAIGTVTSVGLSAPSSDFTVSGSPVTSSGTLGLNWNVAPTDAATANAIVKRDSTGSFNAGAISANGPGNTIVAVMSGNTPQTAAITGIATATGVGNTYGVAGYSATGNGVGVFGQNTGSGNAFYGLASTGAAIWGGSTEAHGVVGYTSGSTAAGVYGQGFGPSLAGSSNPPYVGTGVWGDTSAGNGEAGTAVYGTVDIGEAFRGINDSYDFPTMSISNLDPYGDLFSASSSGSCSIDYNGDLYCTGSKSAVVPVDGGTRKVALYAVEAPENWFEDVGSGQLSNGEAIINLEPVFGQTVNTDTDYHVFLTPKGDCEGLYVSHETATGFEVHELRGGHSNIAFDYRIMAKRKGYEDIRLADKTKAFDVSRFKRPARTGTPPPAPQQMREPRGAMVRPPLAQVTK